MDNSFRNDELLLRAVYPPDRHPDFWRGNRLSSAAFKDKNGLSVDRLYDRELKDGIAFMREERGLKGYIASVSVDDCVSVSAHVAYRPTSNDVYHSEIHGSETQIILSEQQCLGLARKAIIQA